MTKYAWTVKSNSEIGQWHSAATVRGAMRAARQAISGVVSPTRAIVAIDHGDGNYQPIKRLGYYQITRADKWEDAQ